MTLLAPPPNAQYIISNKLNNRSCHESNHTIPRHHLQIPRSHTFIDTFAKRQPIVVDWMAAWCRKCIFLKPKLEKLAAEFDTKVKFYYVDVNKVPQALVKRGNVTKMPTIQVWKDGEMKEEVIGGHQAWLVIEEVREMIRKYV